uniref:Uncharacterized protein n=1 Tax=viral metagenome TaxID=1070528 RepID=A0A6C0C971_9ZZZZ
MDQYLDVQSLVNANLHKSLDITLNGHIFVHSKSCQCKILQISRHHIKWTNICMFKISSMQNSPNLLTSYRMDQYLDISKSCQCGSSQISCYHFECTNICPFKVLSI